MNLLQIIYLVGALALGLIFGMILELMIDAETIRNLQDHNRTLRMELVEAKRAIKKASVEVIEIHDNTIEPQNIPDYKGNF